MLAFMLALADAKLRGGANKQQIRRLEAPTGADQIFFFGDIDKLDTDSIVGSLAPTTTFQYGGFLKFTDGELGAKAILTTTCTQASGEVGAVICSSSSGEQCVPFSSLTDLSDSERGGYCESFLPLQQSVRDEIGTTNAAFGLALYLTCLGTNSNCML